jgi:hypothetical protein
MTALRLAEQRGMNADQMLESMTHQEFDEWCAKDMIEPIGNRGTNEILARLCVLIASYLGQKEAKKEAFAPWMRDPKKEKPVSESVAIAALTIGGARLS